MTGNKKTLDFWSNKKVLVTGGNGFAGRHVIEYLLNTKKVKRDQIIIPDSKKDDLRNIENAKRVLKDVDIVLHLAADVGGIAYSNKHPATQMKNCLLIDLNIFEAASHSHVDKFIYVSSAVAYPANAKTPLTEEDLHLGLPAMGGFGYGMAKRTSVVLAEAYKQERGLNVCVLVPANMYGPGDDFDLNNGHVIPSLIRKCLTEKELMVWGDGSQIRDFLYVKDFAGIVVIAAETLDTHLPINVGSGKGVSIRSLVNIITAATKFKGKVIFDSSKPTGQKERVLSNIKLKEFLGLQPEYSLKAGISETIEWYKEQINSVH